MPVRERVTVTCSRTTGDLARGGGGCARVETVP
jgi:hypothetical protein